MRLDAERSSTYRIFAEYRADRPELQLEKRAAPAGGAAALPRRGPRRRASASQWKDTRAESLKQLCRMKISEASSFALPRDIELAAEDAPRV